MNTRGLMELVILNIGRDLGVITDAVFAMMVIMAIVTTALTTPILHLVHPKVEAEADKLAGEAEENKPFSVLIPVAFPASGALPRPAWPPCSLLPSTPAARSSPCISSDSPTATPIPSACPTPSSEPTETLEPLLAAARHLQIPAEPIAFVSRDIPSDIARIARLRSADLILMGFHKPVFGQAILGGTVHRVMTASDNDVAVFVDRGIAGEIKTILAPYLGGKHDLLALEFAGRIARNSRAALDRPARRPPQPLRKRRRPARPHGGRSHLRRPHAANAGPFPGSSKTNPRSMR